MDPRITGPRASSPDIIAAFLVPLGRLGACAEAAAVATGAVALVGVAEVVVTLPGSVYGTEVGCVGEVVMVRGDSVDIRLLLKQN